MKKSELKSGMLVQNKEGNFGLVLLGTSTGDIIAGAGKHDNTWGPLASFSDDLIYTSGSDYDIVKVYDVKSNHAAASFSTLDRPLLWERSDEVVILNEQYSAVIHKGKDVVVVGCQTIPFSKIEELYNKIKK